MPLFQCKSCAGQFRGGEDLHGKTVTCPHCQRPTKLDPPRHNRAIPPVVAKPPVAAVPGPAGDCLGVAPLSVGQQSGAVGRLARRRKKSKAAAAVMFVSGVLVAAGMVGAVVIAQRSSRELALRPITDQTVSEHQALTLDFQALEAETWDEPIGFELIDPPLGAALDGRTGKFSWTPSEQQGPGTYTLTVRAAAERSQATSEPYKFVVFVSEQNTPPTVEPVADRAVRV